LTTTGAGSNLVLAGDIVAGRNLLLDVSGTISESGGVLATNQLSGSSVGGANFNGTNQVTSFGGFANTGSGDLNFVDAISFETTGNLSTPGNLFLNGPGINLAGNAAASGEISIASTSDLTSSANLELGAGTRIKLGGTSFTQSGTLTITTATPILEIITGSGFTAGNLGCDQCQVASDISLLAEKADPNAIGAVTFANLNAPGSEVLISAGTGTIGGAINVKGLGLAGSGSIASLQGTIDGVTGAAAAQRAVKAPRPDNSYRLNDCAIGSANCVVIVQVVPVLVQPTNIIDLLQATIPTDPLDIDRLDTGSDDGL
jgi:hypothetical protein